MAKKIKGITIEIGGDTQPLNKSLEGVNKKTKDLQSELKQVDRLLKLDPGNTELLAQKQKLLADAVENSKDKLEILRRAQQQVEAQFQKGDIGEEQYRAFQREVIKAEQELQTFENRLQNSGTKARTLKTRLQEVGQAAQEIGGRLKNVGTTMSAAVTAPLVGGFVAVTQGTKEFRRDLSRLEANAKQAGQEMGVLQDAMATLNAVTGETDSSVEGLSNLLATGFRDEQLTELLDSLYGAAIKFSDTLKFEGIADGLQETLATGQAIGPFAELLERSGIVLDDFNAGLQEAIANGEQENYVLQTLASTGLADTYDAWRQNNEELVKAEEANYRMQEAFAKLGASLEPILTPVVEGVTNLVNKFNEMDPAAQKVILVIGGIAAAIGPLLVLIGSIMTALPALGAAVTALTGPIGIVIAAVAALTAIWMKWGDDIKRIVMNAVNRVVAWFTQLKDDAIRILSALPGQLKQIGTDLVTHLWQGIQDKVAWIKDKVTNFSATVRDTIRNFFGISSPSKVMSTYGRYLAEGLAKGISENAAKAADAATQMAQEITDKVAVIQHAVTKTVEGISLQTEIMRAKFDFWKAKFGETASESEKLRQEMDLQQAELDAVNQKVEVLTAAYEDMKKLKGEAAEETQKLYLELIKEKTAQAELQKQIEQTTKAYQAQTNAIAKLLSSQDRDDIARGAAMAYIENTGKTPSKFASGGLYESASSRAKQREEEENDPSFQRNLQALLDFGMGIEEATERLRHAARTDITQNITINSTTPLSPSETARQVKNASRQLALEW